MPKKRTPPTLATVWFSRKDPVKQILRFLKDMGKKREHPWVKELGRAFGAKNEPFAAYWLARRHTLPEYVSDVQPISRPEDLFNALMKSPSLSHDLTSTLGITQYPILSTAHTQFPKKPFTIYIYPRAGMHPWDTFETLIHESSHVYPSYREHRKMARNYPGGFQKLLHDMFLAKDPATRQAADQFVNQFTDTYNPSIPYWDKAQEIFAHSYTPKAAEDVSNFLKHFNALLENNPSLKTKLKQDPDVHRGAINALDLLNIIKSSPTPDPLLSVLQMAQSPQWSPAAKAPLRSMLTSIIMQDPGQSMDAIKAFGAVNTAIDDLYREAQIIEALRQHLGGVP